MRFFAVLAACWLCAASAFSQPPANANSTLALVDANLVDGTGAPARPHVTILISGGRIESIAAASQSESPKDAQVLDLRGMTVIPGLFDSHVHLTGGPANPAVVDRMLRIGLLGGVTSVRDMGGDDIELAQIAQRARNANVASPRIYYSTLVAGPQFFNDPRAKGASHGGVAGQVAWMRAVTPASDIPAIISAGKATGATGLKIYADLTADLVDKLAAEAHKRGLRVWSHSAIFPARPSEVVKAGVDVVSHSVYLGAEGMTHPPDSYEQAHRGAGIDYASSPVDGRAITSLLQLMHDRGTILDETLFVTQLGHTTDSDPIWRWTCAVTKRAHAMGVPLVAGTDSFITPNKGELPNVHREMELLVTYAGLTPLEAIRATTYEGALTVGVEHDYGTIEPGKIADLVILRKDPSRDIRATREIDAVIKGGVIYRVQEKKQK